MSELKLCPFCGGIATLKQSGPKQYTISCENCPAEMVGKYLHFTAEWLQDALTESWNNRLREE